MTNPDAPGVLGEPDAEPNAADPLSEPTLNRRVHAMYLNKGFTRTTFAAAMGVHYVQVARWDSGKHDMSTPHFATAARVLECDAHGLLFGKPAAPAATPTIGLDHAAIRAALDHAHASPAAREAFAEHTDSHAGRYQIVTPAYVERYVRVYERECDEGVARVEAMRAAYLEAVQARALVGAVAAGAIKAGRPAKPKQKPRKRLSRTVGGVVVPPLSPARTRRPLDR